MNFGDLVFATSPETGMFYGIYAGEDRCWKYCTDVQELTNKNIIRCTSIGPAGGVFRGNWFEKKAEEVEVGSEVWCSDSSYEKAIEKPHMTFVVIGKGEKGYRTVTVEDVESYNKGHQVAIIPWAFAVPTGKKVIIADLSVKKKKERPILKKGDRVICVAGNCDVGEGEIYEVLEGEREDSRFVNVLTRNGGKHCFPCRFKKVKPKGYERKWSFEINNDIQVNSSELAENLTRKKPIIYHTGIAKDKAFFEIHGSFIFKWQQFEDLWYEAHQYLTSVRDYETYRTYVTDLSNIDKLLHIFRAVKKRPWPADGYGRRKVEVFRPVL